MPLRIAVAPPTPGPPHLETPAPLETRPSHLQQRASSGREAGPSRQQAGPAAHSYGQQHQQRQRRPAGAAPDVVDLTGSSPPGAGDSDLQIVRSTVARGPSRGAKRPRIQPPPQLSPMKQLLLQQLRNPPPPPPPEAEPEGPKCGICMEVSGSRQAVGEGCCGRAMRSTTHSASLLRGGSSSGRRGSCCVDGPARHVAFCWLAALVSAADTP